METQHPSKQYITPTTEFGTASTELKLADSNIQELELNQSEVDGLRSESNRLEQLVTTTQAHYQREVKRRRRAERITRKVKKELEELKTQLSLDQSQSQIKTEETIVLEHVNRKLRDELSQLKGHTKAYEELMCKLEEVNSQLEQLAKVQEALIRLCLDTEAKQRYKVDRSTNEMKFQLSQYEIDKEAALIEAKRYKELYKAELGKSTRLSSLLQRAKDYNEEFQTSLPHPPIPGLESHTTNTSQPQTLTPSSESAAQREMAQLGGYRDAVLERLVGPTLIETHPHSSF